MRVFISFSGRDVDTARQIAEELANSGVETFLWDGIQSWGDVAKELWDCNTVLQVISDGMKYSSFLQIETMWNSHLRLLYLVTRNEVVAFQVDRDGNWTSEVLNRQPWSVASFLSLVAEADAQWLASSEGS